MELQIIQNKIYTIRGERVMIDRDLAEIYGVETRVLNQAVKRNSERFPSDFMFQLTDIEFQYWKSQIVMSNAINMGLRKRPFVFTELGVAMLSSVLNSKTAIQINMNIMRAFVAVRNMLSISPEDRVSELYGELKALKDYIEEVMTDYNDMNEDTRLQIELINQSLAELYIDKNQNTKPRNKIGFITEE
ncbi:MAG: ORF6N domain-containing protein [Bacteroidota bacterium]|nr:ORF6N domain-containing protein [Bacteroidota bacterium]